MKQLSQHCDVLVPQLQLQLQPNYTVNNISNGVSINNNNSNRDNSNSNRDDTTNSNRDNIVSDSVSVNGGDNSVIDNQDQEQDQYGNLGPACNDRIYRISVEQCKLCSMYMR